MCLRYFQSGGVIRPPDRAGGHCGAHHCAVGALGGERPEAWVVSRAAWEAARTWALKHAQHRCRFKCLDPCSEFGVGR